jgi:hypothetical protein
MHLERPPAPISCELAPPQSLIGDSKCTCHGGMKIHRALGITAKCASFLFLFWHWRNGQFCTLTNTGEMSLA